MCLLFTWSSPSSRQKNFIEEIQAAGKPHLPGSRGGWIYPHPPSSRRRAASGLQASAAPFMCVLSVLFFS